jgi:hypothetical protein
MDFLFTALATHMDLFDCSNHTNTSFLHDYEAGHLYRR